MTAELERTLSDVRAKIHRARISLVSDEKQFLEYYDCVRTQLVRPILDALGWDTTRRDEVKLDYPVGGARRVSTLALFLHGIPSVLVEIRGLGEALDAERVLNELLPHAREKGFEWVILTDGDNYDVYNAHAGLSQERRAFDSVQLSVDTPEEALELFELLSMPCIEENSIEAEWRCRQIDRQVETILQSMLKPDSALAQLLLSESKNLSADDIQGSLARATMSLEFAHCDCAAVNAEWNSGLECKRVNRMSYAELRIATWLQRRSIERWAKWGRVSGRSRASQRRVVDQRRCGADRRSGKHDRRVERIERAQERRTREERRCGERRSNTERRLTSDRRRARRHA